MLKKLAVKMFSKAFKISLLCIILCILCINASADQSLHWYCKRNAKHQQPVLDSQLSCIEQLQSVYVDKQHSDNSDDKVIYLTFDAGYENGNIVQILNVLKQENVPAAFFVLGNLISRNPELVKQMVEDGHLVCNHTYTHKNITKLSEQELVKELQRLEQAYYELTQKQLDKYFRPPEGTFNPKSLEIVCGQGYKTVFWSFAYEDWDNHKQLSEQAAMKKILDNLHNGEIMLLHPTSATNAKIMRDLICELKALGYRFGTLDQLTFDNQ